MARKIRARDILRMAAGGLSGWAIADALGVSRNSASATLAAAEHEGISWGRGADGRLRGLRAAASRKGGGDPAPVGRPCGGLHAVLRHGGSPRDRASRYPGLKQAQDSPAFVLLAMWPLLLLGRTARGAAAERCRGGISMVPKGDIGHRGRRCPISQYQTC